MIHFLKVFLINIFMYLCGREQLLKKHKALQPCTVEFEKSPKLPQRLSVHVASLCLLTCFTVGVMMSHKDWVRSEPEHWDMKENQWRWDPMERHAAPMLLCTEPQNSPGEGFCGAHVCMCLHRNHPHPGVMAHIYTHKPAVAVLGFY